MSKMLFSCCGFCSPLMREKFALVIPRNKQLKQKRCFVLPYAGLDAEKTFNTEKRYLVEFGFDPEKIIFVKTRFDIVGLSPDYIYVPGGDPFKLLNTVRALEVKDDIADCVKNRQTVYIGVSAGADIATPNIKYVTQLEDNNVIKDDFDSLRLIPESLLCHYDHHSLATLKACKEIIGGPIITINDDQLLMFDNGEWKYIGEEK